MLEFQVYRDINFVRNKPKYRLHGKVLIQDRLLDSLHNNLTGVRRKKATSEVSELLYSRAQNH